MNHDAVMQQRDGQCEMSEEEKKKFTSVPAA
jgi:hypothetical protein